MTTTTPAPVLPPHPAADATASPTGGIFRRSAALIAERGWCHGAGLYYIGSPHRPEAASLVGALLWAATGHAGTHDPSAGHALSELRGRIDPHRTAAFDDWELLCAWNDVPNRTRAQAIALLMAAERGGDFHGPQADTIAGTVPSPAPGTLRAAVPAA
ncbi:DUF6197 family protein [Actinacidiphila acididurans]|uniref:Uncharacterized protein n=1 Tax=Actinacidiphila acididurans TaxID=2784346 RepID=A0ABS2TUY8_9ACTN|nr:hypothetical protein [Actinacidiphila acididurans]MBM9507153.1 hypothetical protein [Actinacidiphila acididurans]